MALSAGDQQALDTIMSDGLARAILLMRECGQLKTAYQALSPAQKTSFQTTFPTLFAEFTDINTVMAANVNTRLVIVPATRWLVRERIAEALQQFLADHPETSALLDELRAKLIAAGGTPGVVVAAPVNEDAI